MRRPLSVVLARLPFKRPFMIGVAALLLVGLVGTAVWWQVGAHAAPARVNLDHPVVSDTNVQYTLPSGDTGSAVVTYGHFGCGAIDSNGICTSGVWTGISPAIPGASWIWPTVKWDPNTQGGNPIKFTKQFQIPDNATAIQGQLLITADNYFDVQVNGHEVVSETATNRDWHNTDTEDISADLRPGSNAITVEASNGTGGDWYGNPAGLIFRADASYVPDNTAPVTTASVTGTLGSNGWYRGPVTVTLTATDPDDGSSTLKTSYSLDGGNTWLDYSTPVTIPADGVYSLQYRSVDPATNLEVAAPATAIKIDQTNPVLHESAMATQMFDVCSTDRPVRPSFSPTDAMSGLDGSEGDTWTTPATATGAGVYTYAAHAQDVAGNAISDTRTFTVQYNAAFSGLLDPYKANQTNSFNLGSTIPVKFQLMCNGTPISTAVASLSVNQGSGTAATTKPKKLSTTNTFTYDATSQTYQLNVSTGSGYTNPDSSTVTFAAGTWTFTVNLDDGTTHDFTLQLS